MRSFEIALVEWPEGREAGGPRILGHITDPDLVAQVRDLIATRRRRELSRLESPVRLLPDSDTPDTQVCESSPVQGASRPDGAD